VPLAPHGGAGHSRPLLPQPRAVRHHGGEEGARLLAVSKVFGHLLRVHREGWGRFCAGMGIDPEPCLSWLPGQEALGLAAGLAEQIACTPEQVREFMRRLGGTATAPRTAESVVAELQKSLDVRADWWG
jgi:hypothetical protein